MSPNTLHNITKSPAWLTLTSLFISIVINPHLSSQQTIISKSSTIQATCQYYYSNGNLYTCELVVLIPVNSTDVLEITGTHLANHTDADVEAVTHGINVVAYFNGEVLRKFLNLKIISMVGDTLLAINPGAFDVCPKLESLIIDYGKLTSFPPGLLKNCENLKFFELLATKVETFPEDFFGSTKSLEEFNVAVNQLTTLPEKLLQNMENLKSFRIGFNKLKELNSNLFIGNPNLEQVSAYNNEFQDLNDIAFALNGKTNLKYLMLDNNNITNLDFRFFAQFQKLDYLSVGMSWARKLTNINWHSLPTSLVDLRVYGVGEEIPANGFERLGKLTTLILDGRDFTSFHKDTFKPLNSLVFLYLYDTGLTSLHPELFTNQSNLSNLLIRGSKIEEFPAGIFAPLVSIGIRNINNGIQITGSSIIRLNANSFGEHPHLQNIDFSNNKINEIERGLFSKFHPSLAYAGFYNNDCINKNFAGTDLDNNIEFEQCYKNWEEIDPNNRPTTTGRPATTPSGSGRNFKIFEVLAIIFVGVFKILFDFVGKL